MVLIQAKELLGSDFHIGKYPVTNLQFRHFIEANGYSNDRLWQNQVGRAYRDDEELKEPRFWNEQRFNQPAQPVVGVSWYEANAYWVWLTAQWQATGIIDKGQKVRLPTQAEWMAAARGGQRAPGNEAEDYPWRGPFETTRANTKESGIGQTTPVHKYPNGRTVDGVWDISGNVWEWTNDQASCGCYLKGGSWYDEANSATAAAADYDFRGVRDSSLGFRVVVVPISR